PVSPWIPRAGGHLGRLGVGAIRFPAPTANPSSVFGMGLEPGANLLGLLLEARHLAGFTQAQRRLTRAGKVLLARPCRHPPHGAVHLLRCAPQLLARAASGLGGIAGQLHTIDRQALPPDQALAVADHQPLGKEPTEGLPPRT